MNTNWLQRPLHDGQRAGTRPTLARPGQLNSCQMISSSSLYVLSMSAVMGGKDDGPRVLSQGGLQSSGTRGQLAGGVFTLTLSERNEG
jgi:hypothetical protein